MDVPDSSTTEAITDETGKPRSSARGMRARGNATRLSISSDLRENEPVTEAEIKLIMAALGDTIAQILNPGASE